ncbi:MAG: hypothetical protein C0606_08780 [Hyphomicrobiales bacterium]|nr:MAG: hypothetical protein C0606_08780 [Hyphomicrobiales bacterium]
MKHRPAAIPRTLRTALWAAGVAIALAGCGSEEPVVKKDALEAIAVGATARLAALTDEKPDTACVLYPYHTTVEPNEPDSTRINTALADAGYRGDEMEWTIVLASKAGVKYASFRRTSGLDIMASHELRAEVQAMIPQGFTPSACAPASTAGFAKLVWHERTYLVFGHFD